jgi:prepilin-type N-terminal cleavage/methylation domain-containing protein
VRSFGGGPKGVALTATTRAGFSLVELIIVLALAGILAMTAVPRVTKSVENTQVKQGVSGLQSIWLAQRRYRLQHEQFAPSLGVLVKQGFADKRLQEKKEPFTFSLSLRGDDGLRISARRTGSDGWSGELTLDELGRVRGQVIDRSGHAVAP